MLKKHKTFLCCPSFFFIYHPSGNHSTGSCQNILNSNLFEIQTIVNNLVFEKSYTGNWLVESTLPFCEREISLFLWWQWIGVVSKNNWYLLILSNTISWNIGLVYTLNYNRQNSMKIKRKIMYKKTSYLKVGSLCDGLTRLFILRIRTMQNNI